MQLATLILVTCELSLAIRVPVVWDGSASEVIQNIKKNDEQFSAETFKSNVQNVDTQAKKSIPVEYFQYTAKKPQFAVDIAKFHGVQSPENHYEAYPIKPYNGKTKPELGKHHLLDKGNALHKPLQEFANINEDTVGHAIPVSSNYEVFHPYNAETPALQEIYKDPILTKIRNDLENSKNRLQAYEKETGEPNIHKDEYLESPEKTDNRFFPHRNVPAPYEIHSPHRRPIYYRPDPKNPHREQYLNQRLRHPWNQYSAKIRPMHYRPIKNHIHQLRQNHALKYDDERNEYPQVHVLENYSSDPKDGYDIYERGKEKFTQLRNNVDESINKAVKENRPGTYQKLEMQNNDDLNEDKDEEEFVPIKNYAQVRKTETYKHLPRSAAVDDAENFDEIRNAPRLREAVKSTKAQTVYSEEGYEDTAYDHAGEQKHASENEGHGGYLNEHELSGGKYKTPSESAKYEDGGGSAYRDQIIHAEKWKDDNKDNEKHTDEEDYSENENEHSIEADGVENPSVEDESYRNKRENDMNNDTSTDKLNLSTTNATISSHDIDKRNANFKVPELDLNSTYLTEEEILKLAKIKFEPKKDDTMQKYPYYFKNFKAISKHSPLRYAENLKFIPKKSMGGTEFYDSRSKFECPEVDDVPDPIPDKLNRNGHPDNNDDEDEEASSKKGEENFNTAKKTPRLRDLGNKIDCFKAKYFGENPLDSPFFKEDIILNPEPVTVPNSALFKLKTDVDQKKAESKLKLIPSSIEVNDKNSDIFEILEKLRRDQNQLQNTFIKSNKDLRSSLQTTGNSRLQSNVYSDIIDNIKNNFYNGTVVAKNNLENKTSSRNVTDKPTKDNITYRFFQNVDDITIPPPVLRKKRSSAFVYEPYKIIRDSQVQDSKKTTTTSNISPLIRQLQLSRIVERVPRHNQEIDQTEKQSVKRNVNSRVYKDIGKKDREPSGSKNDKGVVDPSFVDISVDSRRGEPRYEVRHTNHKSRYTPVENKKSISVRDYKTQTSTEQNKARGESSVQRTSRQRNPTVKYASISDVQNVAASSNTVHNTISTTTPKPTQKSIDEKSNNNDESDSEEDYEEYDDEDDEEIITTTTTTPKPSFRRRIRLSTTTEKIPTEETTEEPKLKLVTRFRNYTPEKKGDHLDVKEDVKPRLENNKDQTRESHELTPKYREKKKKSTKSTLVTDTKRYGDDDHDMRKEEVDALIGVKQDMSDYMPSYEKEETKLLKRPSSQEDSRESDEELNDRTDDTDDDEIDDDEDHDDDEDDDDDDADEDDNDEESNNPEPQVTTPEPTKRTLPVTTDAPMPTIASRNINLETKPIVTRKKIEIHKELPVNKSAPHVTQFKQDIKEVEIVKEIPTTSKRKPQKNLEALELYKDDNLAKDVNKLGGVEIFKKDIDLKNGPRHGGNYRSLVEPSAPTPIRNGRKTATKEDTEASQSEFTKHIELEDDVPRNQMHGGNLKSLSDVHKTRNRGRSSKLIELSDPPVPSLHGGHLKHRSRSNTGKSQRLIELDDDEQNEMNDPSTDHESFSNSGNSGPKHGGNYRREKLIATEKPDVVVSPRNNAQNARRTSAAILNSFVQAAPIFTTTPAYILDPSKRMYYYVDA